MPITLMSPKGVNNQPRREMAPRLTSLAGLRIGLLSNNKLNADLLLSETAECFIQQHGGAISELLTKSSPSKPASPEQLAALAKNSDLLITANGD